MNAPTPASLFARDARPLAAAPRSDPRRHRRAPRPAPEPSAEEAALEPFGEPVRRSALRAALGRLARRIAQAFADRQAAVRLHALDDRLLADMGLTRGGIDDAVRRRPPNDPTRW